MSNNQGISCCVTISFTPVEIQFVEERLWISIYELAFMNAAGAAQKATNIAYALHRRNYKNCGLFSIREQYIVRTGAFLSIASRPIDSIGIDVWEEQREHKNEKKSKENDAEAYCVHKMEHLQKHHHRSYNAILSKHLYLWNLLSLSG